MNSASGWGGRSPAGRDATVKAEAYARSANAEVYRRTVITGELTRQEAADAFDFRIGHLGAILTREHQRRSPGTKRPDVPRQRRSYSNRPSAEALLRSRATS